MGSAVVDASGAEPRDQALHGRRAEAAHVAAPFLVCLAAGDRHGAAAVRPWRCTRCAALIACARHAHGCDTGALLGAVREDRRRRLPARLAWSGWPCSAAQGCQAGPARTVGARVVFMAWHGFERSGDARLVGGADGRCGGGRW